MVHTPEICKVLTTVTKKIPKVWVILLVGFVTLFLLWFMFSDNLDTGTPCWALNDHCANTTETITLPEVEIQHNSVFFFESHGHQYVNPRVLCAVESASLAYPTETIYFLSTQRFLFKTKALMDVKKKGNVVLGHLNVEKIFRSSPLKDWYLKRAWKNAPYPMYDLSDGLRWAMLWTYGGTYLDTDTVILRKLPERQKIACWEGEAIGAGALKFLPHDPIIQGICDQISQQGGSQIWGQFGPRVLTKVIENVCLSNRDIALSSGCDQLKILPNKAVYPIDFYSWQTYFKNNSRLSIQMMNDPDIHIIHVWNKASKSIPLDLRLSSPYAAMARHFCPVVVQAVGDVM